MKTLKAPISCLLFCATVATPALAGDIKAYHAAFCKPWDEHSHAKYPIGYVAGEAHGTVCPIIRDDTTLARLPRVIVEAYQSTGGSEDLNCSVWWLAEDGDETLRGVSESGSSSSTGSIQLSFNSLSDYDSGFGTLSLTSGGEGTMALLCYLESSDSVIQYYVEEDMY